jgi:hypothetical protein
MMMTSVLLRIENSERLFIIDLRSVADFVSRTHRR